MQVRFLLLFGFAVTVHALVACGNADQEMPALKRASRSLKRDRLLTSALTLVAPKSRQYRRRRICLRMRSDQNGPPIACPDTSDATIAANHTVAS